MSESSIRCIVAFGANLGTPAECWAAAQQGLDSLPNTRVLRTSSLIDTTPVTLSGTNPDHSPRYTNAALLIETALEPLPLLDALLTLEARLGRVRTVRWGERTADLDLITHGETIIASPRLTLPHPAAWYRRFVLDPVCEIAGEVVHPEREATFAELRSQILAEPFSIGIHGGTESERRSLARHITTLNAEIDVTDQPSDTSHTFDIWLGAGDGTASTISYESLPKWSRFDLSSANDAWAVLEPAIRAARDR